MIYNGEINHSKEQDSSILARQKEQTVHDPASRRMANFEIGPTK
jgi:hypothetical protein